MRQFKQRARTAARRARPRSRPRPPTPGSCRPPPLRTTPGMARPAPARARPARASARPRCPRRPACVAAPAPTAPAAHRSAANLSSSQPPSRNSPGYTHARPLGGMAHVWPQHCSVPICHQSRAATLACHTAVASNATGRKTAISMLHRGISTHFRILPILASPPAFPAHNHKYTTSHPISHT